MRRLLLGVLCVLCGGELLARSWSAKPVQTASQITALLEGARLITGDGSQPIERAAFIVENGRFTRVGRQGELAPPAGASRVDLTGKTVIPALIDASSSRRPATNNL